MLNTLFHNFRLVFLVSTLPSAVTSRMCSNASIATCLNRVHSHVITAHADLAQSTRSLGTIFLIIGELTTKASRPFWRDYVIVLDGSLLWKGSTLLVLCWMARA